MKVLLTVFLCLALTPVWGDESKEFDGTNDVVTLGNVPSLELTTLTWMGWVKRADGQGSYFYNHQYTDKPGTDTGGFKVRISEFSSPNNRLRLYIYHTNSGGNDTRSSNTETTDGAWHHFAISIDGTAVVFYTDGVADGTATLTNPVVYPADGQVTMLAAEQDWSPMNFFAGSLSDFRVYNRVLSADEIAIAYRCINQPVQGLIGHWLLTNDDDDYEDISDGGNDGTCTNCPSNSDDGPITAWCVE